MIDIQKEREAFENWWEALHNGRQIACDYVEEDNSYSVGYANAQWVAWQAAKTQAVPEGFVLVKKVHPDAIVHNQGLGLFKECQVIYGWDGKSKDFKDALNKGFYHGVKLGAKAVLETAMIEAQEQGHNGL